MLDPKMQKLYSALQPIERARLMAKVNRSGAYNDMWHIRDTVPASQASAYNHLLANRASVAWPTRR